VAAQVPGEHLGQRGRGIRGVGLLVRQRLDERTLACHRYAGPRPVQRFEQRAWRLGGGEQVLGQLDIPPPLDALQQLDARQAVEAEVALEAGVEVGRRRRRAGTQLGQQRRDQRQQLTVVGVGCLGLDHDGRLWRSRHRAAGLTARGRSSSIPVRQPGNARST
jgi:hypothetical protein